MPSVNMARWWENTDWSDINTLQSLWRYRFARRYRGRPLGLKDNGNVFWRGALYMAETVGRGLLHGTHADTIGLE